MRRQRSILMPAVALALLVGVIAGGSGVVSAQDDVLAVPAGTVILGSPGDVVELGRLPVDNSRAGPLCTWTATATNQESVHPGSDVLVTSNGETLVLADVEAAPNKVTTNTGSVFLADEVVISIRLGPDGRFSGRMNVAITYSSCGPAPTTTILDTTTTQVTAADTTAATEPEGPVVSATTTETTAEATTTETTAEATTTETTADATTTETTAAATTTETTVASATATTTAPTAPDALPTTGSELTLPLFGAGLALAVAGSGLVSVARRRAAST